MDCQWDWQLESSVWWAQREREREKRERSVPVRSDLSHILPLPFLIRQCVEQADVMLQDKLWSSTMKLETVMMMMMMTTKMMMIPTHNFRFVCRVNHHWLRFFSLIMAFSSFFLSELCFANHQLMLISSTYLTAWLSGCTQSRKFRDALLCLTNSAKLYFWCYQEISVLIGTHQY
jgi:hypothetical protein